MGDRNQAISELGDQENSGQKIGMRKIQGKGEFGIVWFKRQKS